jgi:hypothetical protein
MLCHVWSGFVWLYCVVLIFVLVVVEFIQVGLRMLCTLCTFAKPATATTATTSRTTDASALVHALIGTVKLGPTAIVNGDANVRADHDVNNS